MILAERQRYALEHPLAGSVFAQKPNPKFREMERIGTLRVSSVLTVDDTGGRPGLAWHASIAVVTKKGELVKPIGGVTVTQMEQIVTRLKELLDGVGTGETWTYKPEYHIHLFGALTAEERAEANKRTGVNN